MAAQVLKRNESKSSPGVFHEIRVSEDKADVYCTCPAWRFSKFRPRNCKHLVSYFNAKAVRKAA